MFRSRSYVDMFPISWSCVDVEQRYLIVFSRRIDLWQRKILKSSGQIMFQVPHCTLFGDVSFQVPFSLI